MLGGEAATLLLLVCLSELKSTKRLEVPNLHIHRHAQTWSDPPLEKRQCALQSPSKFTWSSNTSLNSRITKSEPRSSLGLAGPAPGVGREKKVLESRGTGSNR